MARSSAQERSSPVERTYHLDALPGDVARHVILVGDPDRARRAARHLAPVRFENEHREFAIFTGCYRELDVSVVSVGIGAGAMEIAVVELCQLVDRPCFLRAGTCGSLRGDVRLGHLVISQAAVRMESASLGYVDAGYPAFAHAEAQLALVQAAEQLGAPYHVGVTATAAGFYGAQARQVAGFAPRDEELLARLARQRVLSLEMETSCLFTLTALRGARAGSVCAVVASRTSEAMIAAPEKDEAEERLVRVALEAMVHLARMESERGGRALWHPGLAR